MEVAAPAARLTVVFPRALAASFVVEGRPFVIGRRGDGQVCHPTVSRAHLAIAWSAEAGAHLARDLDSHNGSALDGAPLGRRPRVLHDGSVLRLGDVLLVWECSAAVAAPAEGEGVRDEVLEEAVPGNAAAVRTLRAAIARAAGDTAPVLIVGETGSGKERVARELHRRSGRSGALVALNCAALQPTLIESELFGHGRGAFTGAYEAQRGFFRDAQGGSLFLDEIGELPPALQAKLLRAIQEHEVQPVGGGDPVAVDVRVIAATHRKPAEAIAAGRLREDLYARLSLWQLEVPPLRARRVDLHDWLYRMHAARAADAAQRALPPLSVDAMELLLIQRWPFNLRRIERLVRELATLPADRLVEPGDLPAWLDTQLPVATPAGPGAGPGTAPGASDDHSGGASDGAPTAGGATRETTELRLDESVDLPRVRPPLPTRDEFVTAFESLNGSVRALARHFGRERRQIYRWIEAHGVRGPR